MSQRVICREGALDDLPGILAENDARRVFLVTGRTSYAASGAENRLSDMLAGRSVKRFCDFQENPRIEDVVAGIEAYRLADPDLVIAVGGGTAMDLAKIINALAWRQKDPIEYIEGREKLTPGGRRLIAIPTTAGSGSQATPFSVVYVNRTKHSAGHPCMLPTVSIVDPALLKSLPSHVAASAGLDALSQGIESYWSIHSTEASQAKAREAIVNAWTHLARFVNHPDDTARRGMALAAHLAGEAISVTRTTAPHAVSYPITAHYGVSHGHAVGLILPAIFIYNGGVSDQDCLHGKGPRHVRGTLTEIANLLEAETPTEAAQRYQSLMDEIGLTSDLRTLGIGTPGDIDTIVDNGFNPERVNNGPRRLTANALRQMLAARLIPMQQRRNEYYGRPRFVTGHHRSTQGR
jgi:alcohol dehydrogenase class IV